MRDRLIEILKYRRHLETSELADVLLENGVIVPPCKVGDTVYVIKIPWVTLALNKVVEGEVVSIHYHEYGSFMRVLFDERNINGCRDYDFERELGKTVFLTREEAERALKGGDGE